jgi:hypothetical protein
MECAEPCHAGWLGPDIVVVWHHMSTQGLQSGIAQGVQSVCMHMRLL